MSRLRGFALLATCAVQALWLAVSPTAAQQASHTDAPPTLREFHLEPQAPKAGHGHYRIAAELRPASPNAVVGQAGSLHLAATFAPDAPLGCEPPAPAIFSDGFEP